MAIMRTPSANLRAAIITLSFVILAQSALLAQAAETPSKTKILLLATPPDHPYGTHMYLNGCELLAKCLRQNPSVEAVVSLGWPTDPKMLEGVKAIALYSGPGDFVLRGEHQKTFEELIAQGVGFSALHWSTGAMPDRAEQYKSCLGGYFVPKFGLNTTTTTVQQVVTDHPICRGWKNFELLDEIYLDPELLDETRAVAKVHVPKADGSDPKDHTIAWTYDRPGDSGGRSFACTLGHFHTLFEIEGLRRLFANGILWTAGVDVPSGGAACKIDPKDLDLPPDPAVVAEVKRFDKNSDGDLDQAELDLLVKDRIEKQKATPLFLQVFDKDRDGKLSDEELKQAHPLVKQHFIQQCRQGNVPIGAAEEN